MSAKKTQTPVGPIVESAAMADRPDIVTRLYQRASEIRGDRGGIWSLLLDAAAELNALRRQLGQATKDGDAPICMFCDGCGWCEGSPAFTCPRCGGTGAQVAKDHEAQGANADQLRPDGESISTPPICVCGGLRDDGTTYCMGHTPTAPTKEADGR